MQVDSRLRAVRVNVLSLTGKTSWFSPIGGLENESITQKCMYLYYWKFVLQVELCKNALQSSRVGPIQLCPVSECCVFVIINSDRILQDFE